MTSVSQSEVVSVIIGVDTHKKFHVAIGIDLSGRLLGELIVPTTTAGYESLEAWSLGFGKIEAFGIEGTGSYGSGLSRYLQRRKHCVVEVNRADRSARRNRGKSDPIDAEAAARSVLAGVATAVPKSANDEVEMIRLLKVARRGAMKARTTTATTMHATVVSVPQELRDSLSGLSIFKLVVACAKLRPGRISSPTAAAKMTMRSLARRYQQLTDEIKALDVELERLIAKAAPGLIEVFGVGTGVAGTLLSVAGDNPERPKSEASFASLCGASPVPASSGRTQRHRLSRGGNRQANCALHSVILTRMVHHEPTKEYVKRRTTEGLSKREIMRCLKRYLVREIYRALLADGKHRELTSRLTSIEASATTCENA